MQNPLKGQKVKINIICCSITVTLHIFSERSEYIEICCSLTEKNALDLFCVDLTARASNGSIDPVIGRDTEIQRVIQILCRRTKSNPILLGEAGVGKTAIAEGLALNIADGSVPFFLMVSLLSIKE